VKKFEVDIGKVIYQIATIQVEAVNDGELEESIKSGELDEIIQYEDYETEILINSIKEI